MSSVGRTAQLLQQDIQNELVIANQLLRQISADLHLIKNITNPGGEFEANIKENAAIVGKLANLRNVDLEKITPILRNHIGKNAHENQKKSQEVHNNSSHNDSDMNETQ